MGDDDHASGGDVWRDRHSDACQTLLCDPGGANKGKLMRKLSDAFMEDLQGLKRYTSSRLSTRIHWDETLMLAIRDGYINVYYRGGNLIVYRGEKARLLSGAVRHELLSD